MKTRFLILFIISIAITILFAANFFMNLYHYGSYLKIEDGHIWHCISEEQTQTCNNTSIRMMELFGPEHCPGLEMRKSLGLVDPTAMCL
ncbi:hypothetical protein [Nitrosopumilus adriaticus]|uniref:hypothetical protein n=1 Tax=Nitrosopumilus adriaticus TaxID=1580092 RepID=UPI00352CF737